MTDETMKIYVWPNGHWESEDDVKDIDLFCELNGKSDDYFEHYLSTELDAEDINELIELKALPGMLKDTVKTKLEGIIDLPKDSVLIINCPSEDGYVTQLKNKIVINCSKMSIEVLKGDA